ncbi:hypothetical protein GFGA_1c0846 [Gluconobacter frateurii NBRC 103465]|nr:hypothetical protein GFGA_1c0846 [Gluconobacter frateurii NBRC 103465]
MRFTKMMPLNTRRSSTRGLPWLLGKRAADDPSVHPSAKTGRSLPVSSQSLNKISTIKSMGPEPMIGAGLTFFNDDELKVINTFP